MYAKFVHRAVLISLLALAYPAASFAAYIGVGVSAGFAPPPLPVYVQPPCPAPGFIWTPGYWAYTYDARDYYWVPGTWVLAPAFGLLWTPGYWGLFGAGYVWHEGYWGPHVGFYGGINYGFGYFGSGFVGGYWHNRNFYYNRAVANVSNMSVTHVYNRTVVNNNFYGSRPSFNGTDGVPARPTHSDLLAMREPHRALTPQQRSRAASARVLPSALASVNHGQPQIAVTPRPGVFGDHPVAAPRYANRTSAPAQWSAATQNRSPPPHTQTSPHAPYDRSASAAQAPRSAPALHSTFQPPHSSHQAPAQSPRHS